MDANQTDRSSRESESTTLIKARLIKQIKQRKKQKKNDMWLTDILIALG
jgi:hypothetical protein